VRGIWALGRFRFLGPGRPVRQRREEDEVAIAQPHSRECRGEPVAASKGWTIADEHVYQDDTYRRRLIRILPCGARCEAVRRWDPTSSPSNG
jgi:hypothetical protein